MDHRPRILPGQSHLRRLRAALRQNPVPNKHEPHRLRPVDNHDAELEKQPNQLQEKRGTSRLAHEQISQRKPTPE